MAKITKAGGASNAGLTRAAFGGHVDAGLNERAAGFSDDTAAIRDAADERQETAPEPSVSAPFDPGEYSVTEVMGARSDCTDAEWAAVLASERAGKDRAGIK